MAKRKTGKVTETQMLIINAFFELLEDMAYEDISVSEICSRAQVARKTFYNNFKAKDDIVGMSVDYFFDNWEALSNLRTTDIRAVYRSAFDFIDGNKQLFTLLYNRGLFRLAESKLVAYCAEKWPGGAEDCAIGASFKNYYIPAMIAAFISIVKTWIDSGFKESVDTLVGLADALIISTSR